MSENKKQHVVPKFYLKGFSSDGERFYQFSGKRQKKTIVNIKDVCTRNYFYDISPESNHQFERELSVLEASQNRFLQSFLNQVREKKCNLDSEVRFNLLYFLLFMHIRGFCVRENISRAITESLNFSLKMCLNNKSFIEKKVMEESGIQLSLNSNEIRDSLTKEGEKLLHSHLFDLPQVVAKQLNLTVFFHIYCIIKDKDVLGKSSFFTSDNPVFYKSLVDNGIYGQYGYLLPGTFFFMPLSYDVFAIIGDDEYRDKSKSNEKNDIIYLYTSDANTNNFINNINKMIIQSSSDLLFSIDSNFILPKLILKLHNKGLM